MTFTVVATGTPTPAYQWLKNGTNLVGATSSTLTLNNVTSTDAGNYSVVVSNVVNSVTSSTAVLTVNSAVVAPSIVTEPASQTVSVGATVTFTVTATGTGPLSYQWLKNGTNIPSAINASFVINNVQTTDTGTYVVIVSNSAGNAITDGASLTVGASATPPSITTQPKAVSAALGSAAALTVSASGTATLHYQWQKNGTNITGANSIALVFNHLQLTDAGTYDVVVTNAVGSVTSATVLISVIVPPTVTTQPQPLTLLVGQTANFSVTVDGTAPFYYQWQKNSANITSATNSTLSLANLQTGNAGNYSVIITNGGGSVTSSVVALQVVVPVVITGQPVGQSLFGGGTITLACTITGDGPYTYQWQKNGTNLPNSTSSALSITGITRRDSGTYRLLVSNSSSSTNSTDAVVRVRTAQDIATPKLNGDGSWRISFADSDGTPMIQSDTTNFQVQLSADLKNWTSSTNQLNVSNGAIWFDDSVSNQFKFYRVLEP